MKSSADQLYTRLSCTGICWIDVELTVFHGVFFFFLLRVSKIPRCLFQVKQKQNIKYLAKINDVYFMISQSKLLWSNAILAFDKLDSQVGLIKIRTFGTEFQPSCHLKKCVVQLHDSFVTKPSRILHVVSAWNSQLSSLERSLSFLYISLCKKWINLGLVGFMDKWFGSSFFIGLRRSTIDWSGGSPPSSGE